MFRYSRGVWVEDLVTGFSGVIIGRADYLTGCNQYLVKPRVDSEGKNIDALWLDEMSLKIDETKQRLTLDYAFEPPG